MLARRQFNDKFGPSSLGLLSTNMPAMRFNDRTTDKESNAQTGFFVEKNASKSFGRSAAGIPVPVSLISIITLSPRSEEHTSELQSLMRISYAVFCLKKKRTHSQHSSELHITK